MDLGGPGPSSPCPSQSAIDGPWTRWTCGDKVPSSDALPQGGGGAEEPPGAPGGRAIGCPCPAVRPREGTLPLPLQQLGAVELPCCRAPSPPHGCRPQLSRPDAAAPPPPSPWPARAPIPLLLPRARALPVPHFRRGAGETISEAEVSSLPPIATTVAALVADTTADLTNRSDRHPDTRSSNRMGEASDATEDVRNVKMR